MKKILIRSIAGFILQIECLCLIGVLKFTDGYIYVRLVNPSSSVSNPTAGRLEVRRDYGAWGTVCDDGFTDAAARVVCSSLGFGRTGTFNQNAFGPGSGSIWMDDVSCTGSETSINSCGRSSWGNHNCDHSEDVSISCDIDECSTGRSQCNAFSTICVNTVGSYRCSCRSGFRTMTSTSCTDIDECSTGQSQCSSATTTCINTVGSYRCSCRNGYRVMNSTWCTDIDECSTGQSQCDSATTTCSNTPGSYQCSCKSGYRPLNSLFCTDTDECVSGESECDMVSTNCTNTIGNYTCRCKIGFAYLNETMCLALVKESSLGRFGVIVGSSAGTFLVVASIAILFLVFFWKRRKEVNQPQQTECSGVDSCRRSDDRNSKISNVYMPLEPTECDMAGKRADYAKNAAYVQILAPNQKSKMTAESANDEDVYANVQFVCDEDAESTIYANVRFANDEDVESAIYEDFLV